MSNLSELLPSGGGQNVVEFTASGAVASGKPVILNSDGTVTEVAETTASTGTPTSFDNDSSNSFAVTCDVNSGKVVIAYRDGGNSGYGTAVVATVSDTSISYGTGVVFNSANTGSIDICYDSSNNKVVICYENEGTNYGTAVVGTVSGTSISFGSASTFYTTGNGTDYIGCDFDSNANKVCVAYSERNSLTGKASIGTVSGTSITFGSDVTFSSQTTNWVDVVFYASQNKMLISYQNAGNSNYGFCIAGTISGTSISFGSAVALPSSAKTIYGKLAYDSVNNVAVYAFRNFGVTNYGEAIVVTVSSSSVVTYGTATTFSTNQSNWLSPVYDIKTGKIVIAWNDAPSGSENGKLIVGTVSGTSISFGSASTFQSGNSLYMAAGYDSVTERTVIAYRQPTTNYSVGVVYRDLSTNLTAASFIGLASAAISDTASGDINVKGGINEAQTGLTIGSDYYVQNDGSLAATSIPYDISSASYDSVSFSVTSQDTEPVGLTFNTDGTKMFIVGTTNDNVYEYALSTAYDISSASYTQSFSVSSQDTFPTGVRFNNDGTKMFVVGGAGQDINEYGLSSAFDISSASYTRNFSTSAQETAPNGLAFNTDGTKMFVSGGSGQDVNEYSLSTGFDLSSVTFTQNFSVSSQDTLPREVTFNSDGTKMYIVGSTNDSVFQYNLTTGFDLSTASYADISFSLSSQDTSPEGIAFNSSGTKMYIVGDANDSVYQYSTTAASTTVKVGQAISATTINMMDLT